MRLADHTRVQAALAEYMAARVPTSPLTQALVGIVAQVIANDMSDDVTVLIGRTITIRRSPTSPPK